MEWSGWFHLVGESGTSINYTCCQCYIVGGQSIDLGASSTNPVDLNTLTTPGAYHQLNTGVDKVTNKPSGAGSRGFRIEVIPALGLGTTYIRQRYQEYNSIDLYERVTANGGSSWSPGWTKVQGA